MLVPHYLMEGQMGTLVVNSIDINEAEVINNLLSAIQSFVDDPSSYYPLRYKPKSYFEIPNTSCPSERGWYIILNGKMPVYVGIADNLNSRLNTDNGSRDNFANPKRGSDPERNFLKKFTELGVFDDLRVCMILERDLCSYLRIDPSIVTKLDRSNLEKLINIYRCQFDYL